MPEHALDLARLPRPDDDQSGVVHFADLDHGRSDVPDRLDERRLDSELAQALLCPPKLGAWFHGRCLADDDGRDTRHHELGLVELCELGGALERPVRDVGVVVREQDVHLNLPGHGVVGMFVRPEESGIRGCAAALTDFY